MCTRKEKEKGKGKEKKIRKGFVSIDKQHLLNRHSTSFRSFVTSRVTQPRRKLPLFAPPTTPPSPLPSSSFLLSVLTTNGNEAWRRSYEIGFFQF